MDFNSLLQLITQAKALGFSSVIDLQHYFDGYGITDNYKKLNLINACYVYGVRL